MDRQSFCQQVLAQIRHATPEEQEEVRRELLDHLEDHREALMESGYPEEEADARAVEAMGEPEEIGRKLNRLYPLGWLVLSRAALIGTILLCISMMFSFPVLGNLFNSIQARWNPEGAKFRSALEDGYISRELDIKVPVGDDVVYIYQVGILPSADGQSGLASVAYCNYDRNLFGYASDRLHGGIQVVTADGERSHSGGGGGNVGAYYWVADEILVNREQETLTMTYDAFGEHLHVEVPLCWEEVT